jgi:hypothetical protein
MITDPGGPKLADLKDPDQEHSIILVYCMAIHFLFYRELPVSEPKKRLISTYSLYLGEKSSSDLSLY